MLSSNTCFPQQEAVSGILRSHVTLWGGELSCPFQFPWIQVHKVVPCMRRSLGSQHVSFCSNQPLSWQSACQHLQQSAWMAMTGRQAGLVLVQSVLQHMHVAHWDSAENLELTGWAALQPCCF